MILTKEELELIESFSESPMFMNLIVEINAQLTRPIQRGHINKEDAAKQAVEQALAVLKLLSQIKEEEQLPEEPI